MNGDDLIKFGRWCLKVFLLYWLVVLAVLFALLLFSSCGTFARTTHFQKSVADTTLVYDSQTDWQR